jgi:hypothetical protein
VKAQGKFAMIQKQSALQNTRRIFFEIVIEMSIGARGANGVATRHLMTVRIGRAITSN